MSVKLYAISASSRRGTSGLPTSMPTCSRPNTEVKSFSIPFTEICYRRRSGADLIAFFLFDWTIQPHWPSAATDYRALEKVLSCLRRWFPAPLVRRLLLSADILPHEEACLAPLPTQILYTYCRFLIFVHHWTVVQYRPLGANALGFFVGATLILSYTDRRASYRRSDRMALSRHRLLHVR
jgi:hypothetical protein